MWWLCVLVRPPQLVQQAAWWHSQTPRETQDRRHSGLACPPLKAADRRVVDVGLIGEFFLSQAAFESQLSKAQAESDPRGLWILVEVCIGPSLPGGRRMLPSGLASNALV